MAYKRVPHGYEVTNPYGELLMYHDVQITIDAGVLYDHDDIVGANGQTTFSLSLASSSTELLEDTLEVNFGGVTYTESIVSGDVVFGSDVLGHTVVISAFQAFPTATNNPRNNNALLTIGGHTLRYDTIGITSGSGLTITFESQSQRGREFQAIQDELTGGAADFNIRFLGGPAVVASVADAATLTPDVTLTQASFEDEPVSFDFQEKVSVTHEVTAAAGGAQIPLVFGDVLEFPGGDQTGKYVVVDDTPVRNRKSYYV